MDMLLILALVLVEYKVAQQLVKGLGVVTDGAFGPPVRRRRARR